MSQNVEKIILNPESAAPLFFIAVLAGIAVYNIIMFIGVCIKKRRLEKIMEEFKKEELGEEPQRSTFWDMQ